MMRPLESRPNATHGPSLDRRALRAAVLRTARAGVRMRGGMGSISRMDRDTQALHAPRRSVREAGDRGR
jgi:hypothetical protein